MPPPVRAETLVRLTRSTSAAAPLMPTLWVVVESAGMNPAAPQIYRIQMWRLTVIRTVPSAPNRQPFRSET